MPDVSSFKVIAPKLPLQSQGIERDSLAPNATLRRFSLKQAACKSVVAIALDLGEGRCDGVELDNAKLTKLLVNDTVFKHCSFANADCSESSLIRVEFSDSRMTGWDVNMASFEDVTIVDCKLDMANLRAAKLKRIRFRGCLLREADFLSANLEDVSFEDCLLDKTQFSQCKMKNVDFRTSTLVDVSGWQSLKGATIDSIQLAAAAPYLAHALGIIIQD